jgi:hypothetical protein
MCPRRDEGPCILIVLLQYFFRVVCVRLLEILPVTRCVREESCLDSVFVYLLGNVFFILIRYVYLRP